MKKLTDKNSKMKKFKPLSASLIASVLFAMGPEEVVVAEEAEDTDNLLEIKSLHEEYHSLLSDVEDTQEAVVEDSAETEEVSEDIAEEETTTDISESHLVSDFDEINEVKRLLLHAIEKAGTTAYANELQANDLTIDELDQIFEQLIIENVDNNDSEAVDAEDTTEEADTPAVESEPEVSEEKEDSSEEVVEEDTVEEVETPAVEPEPEVSEEDSSEDIDTEDTVEEAEIPAVEPEPEVSEEDSSEDIDAEDTVEEDESPDVEPEPEVSEEEGETSGEDPEVVAEDEKVEETEEEASEESTTEENEEASSDDAEDAGLEETPEEEEEETVVEPEETTAPIAMASTMSASANQPTVTYTVRSGDTLNRIASNYGVSVNHLVSLNDIVNRNNIQVGQTLLINGNKEELENLNQNLTNSEFINIVGENARKIADDHNLYASVMVAQAALESGFGSSGLASAPNYNLFGIKGTYNGESVTLQTREYGSNGWITIYDQFKKYPSYYESLLDNARLLRNGTSWDPQFYDGTWLENADNYSEATDWLEGRYATDPTYANKLNNMIERYNLTQFDEVLSDDVTPSTGDEPAPAPTPEDEQESESQPETEQKPEANPVPSGSTYKVVRGDTLSRIGREYNMSVSELKRLNNLSSDTIYVGQTLKVNEKSSTPAPSTPAPESPSSNSSTYIVKSGDTLSGIARAHGVTVSNMMSWNNLQNANVIRANQELNIKDQTSTPSTPAPESPSSNSSTYTVKSGDTLSGIAREHGVTVSNLVSWNNLQNANVIRVNQELNIKDQTSTPSTPAPESPSSNSSTYTVKSGDTLSGIARTHGVTVSNLVSWNNLQNANVIRVNQGLEIRGQESSSSSDSTSTSAPTANTYTVVRGDTLSGISRKYNMSVNELKRLNNLNSDTIYVDQTLKVNENNSSSTSETSNPVSPSTSETSYTVKSGDTLSGIARDHGVTVSNLMSWNNLDNADVIRVNQQLDIKGQSSTPSNTTPAPDSSSSNSSTYTVKSGDTLSGIARAHGVTVSNLMSWNNLDNANVIRVNQQLDIKGQSSTPSNTTPAPESSSSNSSTYTVKSGDTLSGIAREYGVTVSNLMSWNSLDNADVIRVNQELTVKQAGNQSESNSSVENNKAYEIVSGDTLSGIARQFNTTVSALKNSNNLRSDLIFVGQTLRV